MTPLTGGIEAGREPVALQVNGVRYAPNICYETVLPHVIRQHVVELAAQGQPADVLVNVTNDAWFWGSSELDMHLACGVFRAIETRRPLLIAANGGISAAIDVRGNIRQQSPRQQQDVIIAEVLLDGRQSPYVRYGDWFAMLCLISCLVLGGYELVARRLWPSAPRVETAR